MSSINQNSNYIESRCFQIARQLAITAPTSIVSPIFNIQSFQTKMRDGSVINNGLGDAISIYFIGNGTGVAKLDKIEVSSSPTFASDIHELTAEDYQSSNMAYDYKNFTEITDTEISRKLGVKTAKFGKYPYVRVTTQVVSATGLALEVFFDINPKKY